MLDILKRKKPHTPSSSQSTLVVTPMPSSQSTYATYASMPSSQSTLVGDNYAQYAPMPSSLVDVPKPHHLRRETRKIKEYKDKRDLVSKEVLRKRLGEIPQNLEVEQPPYSSSLLPARHHDTSVAINRYQNQWREGSIKIINKINNKLQDKFDVGVGK